jgi:hypothetical protein
MTRTAASLVALLACSTAAAREVYGIKIPDTVESGGATLRLNGAGVREGTTSGATWQVGVIYVCALYLTVPASNMAAIVDSDAPWVVRMHFALDMPQRVVMNGFRTSFQQNYPKERVAQLLPKLDSLAPAIPDVKAGQTLVLAYRPGTGTTVGVDGGAQVTVEGKEFGDALLGNWIGSKPTQEVLKRKMLNQ